MLNHHSLPLFAAAHHCLILSTTLSTSVSSIHRVYCYPPPVHHLSTTCPPPVHHCQVLTAYNPLELALNMTNQLTHSFTHSLPHSFTPSLTDCHPDHRPSLVPGTFEADAEIGLPCGSLLVLQGNGADVAQHCVPRVTAERVSVTLRRMRPVFREEVSNLKRYIFKSKQKKINETLFT
jgi:hypothetical protein